MHSNILFAFCAVLYTSCILSSVSGKTVQWTAAGGNPLWDTPNNWDSLAVPTISDDVIINVANIAGNVRIGSGTAYCNSLTVGGNSGTSQSLTVFTSLVIGTGGANILSNGQIILNSSPTNPLTTAGIFNGINKFTFISGTLGGTGSFLFSYVPFNTTALKVINTTVTITTLVELLPITGPASVEIGSKGVLDVKGTLSTTATTTLTSDKGGLLSVEGVLEYEGGQTDTFTILGDAQVAQLNVGSGTVILNDNVTVLQTTVSSGAFLKVIGASTSIRKFGDVTGTGSLLVQGGTNSFSSFTNFGSVQLSGGLLIVNDKASTISNLIQTGGEIEGGASVSIKAATLSNSDIFNTPVTVSVLYINGYTSVSGSSLTVTSQSVIQSTSQFTLSNGAQFVVGPNAQVVQSYAFQILPSSGPAPQFVHNGAWTSTSSDFKILVKTTGSGSFSLGNGASVEVTGVDFTTGSLTSNGGTFTSISSVVNVDAVSGTGNIVSQGQSFVVSTSLAASSVSVTNGLFSASGVVVTSFNLTYGIVNLTSATASISALAIEGGTVNGVAGTNTVLTVESLNITGTQPKTFANVDTIFTTLDLDCEADQCQLFTSKAKLYSKSAWQRVQKQ